MVNGSAMGLLLHNKRSFVLFLRRVVLVTTTKTSSSTSIAADLGLQSSLFCLSFADLYSEKQGSSAFWVGMEHYTFNSTHLKKITIELRLVYGRGADMKKEGRCCSHFIPGSCRTKKAQVCWWTEATETGFQRVPKITL